MSVASLLAEIEDIGRDGASGGYRRFAFTGADAALGEWFASAATDRGATVTVDRCGNQWAWWGDPEAALARGEAAVVTGSHLDSVPDGGPMDGPLGVVSALSAVESLSPSGFRRPLGVVRFVDEEGARFGLACSGSRLLTGAVAPERVLSLRDADGVTYADAVSSAGLDPARIGRDEDTLRRIGSFVELHVEQGRALATPECRAAVGVASRIRPHGRWRVDLAGRADHAGTTLLADRDDPMLALAGVILGARTAAERQGALATIGRVEVRPNAVNAIPSSVRAWLDVRADTEPQVRAVLAELAASASVSPIEESWTAATGFDAALSDRCVGAVGRALGGAHVPVLATGAGHDAGVLAQAGIPTAMLFVRNPTGVSHAPDEHAEEADCERGVLALAAVLGDLLGARAGEAPR
jgi:N-carbamoyl-L-amino-acid hydrolase